MNYKSSSFEEGLSHFPNHPNRISTIDVHTVRDVPLVDDSFYTGEASALAITANGQSPYPLNVINESLEMHKLCNLAQLPLQTLSQAVGRHHGVSTAVASLVDNRLQAAGDRFSEPGLWCTGLQKSHRPHMNIFDGQTHRLSHEHPELDLHERVQNMGAKTERMPFSVAPLGHIYGHTDLMSGILTSGSNNSYPSASFRSLNNGNSIHGPPVQHHVYGMPGLQFCQGRLHDRLHLNHPDHLVRERSHLEFKAQENQFRAQFEKLLSIIIDWSKEYVRVCCPGINERALINNPGLWEYILRAARCHNDDGRGTTKHALFMLESHIYCVQFVARMVFQYIQKEIFHPRFWVGFDAHSDSIMTLPALPELATGLIDQRCVMNANVPHPDVLLDFRMNEQVNAIMSIAGPFLRNGLEQQKVIFSLQYITKIAIECSANMMKSCLPFSFSWDECGVMFNDESHAVLNGTTVGFTPQQNYMRVALVVTPRISIDSGYNNLSHTICKANVLTMR